MKLNLFWFIFGIILLVLSAIEFFQGQIFFPIINLVLAFILIVKAIKEYVNMAHERLNQEVLQ